MRTTLDLPDELLKRAKIAAVQRCTTLRELVSQALVRELGSTEVAGARPRRVQFPLVKSSRPGQVEVTDEDIRKLELEDDQTRSGF